MRSLFKDHPMHFKNMKDFLWAIETMPLKTQAKLVGLLLEADMGCITDPYLQDWVSLNSDFLSRMYQAPADAAKPRRKPKKAAPSRGKYRGCC